MSDGINLLETTDAAVWAKEFMRITQGQVDESDMVGWFANMWAATNDPLSRYFEQGIKDDAERAGIDTRGLVGMAIVHTMADEIERLLKIEKAARYMVAEWQIDWDKGRPSIDTEQAARVLLEALSTGGDDG